MFVCRAADHSLPTICARISAKPVILSEPTRSGSRVVEIHQGVPLCTGHVSKSDMVQGAEMQEQREEVEGS
tara:strand:- start:927 stop:1139 length:213 start_codon:yes stop_codon:yes gene_type:complete